jgi:transcription termination/antitermination protein NusG
MAVLMGRSVASSSYPAITTGRLFSDLPGEWHVLWTKSRQEKALAEELGRQGIRHFLPLLRQERYQSGRRTVVDAPLFPGYVFLHGTREDAFRSDDTRRVAQIIKVVNQEQLAEELSALHFALASEAPLVAYPYLKKGVRVEVKSGPFRGLRGVVEDRINARRLILQINLLTQAVSMEIDGALLEPIDD